MLFGVIDEYTISVERDNGPAVAVMLSVGLIRSTAGCKVSEFQLRETRKTY